MAGRRPARAAIRRSPSRCRACSTSWTTLGLRATFCVEALNCELYPDAVRGIAARGHEVAMHAWRHEAWGDLDPAREDDLLARGRAAFAALGVDGVAGFRPPGGALTAASARLLERHGFTWCSPLGRRARARRPASRASRSRGRWSTPTTASTRSRPAAARHGDPEAALGPDATAAALLAALAGGATPTLILHPFLMVDDEGWAAARRVLRTRRRRRAARAAWSPTAGRGRRRAVAACDTVVKRFPYIAAP